MSSITANQIFVLLSNLSQALNTCEDEFSNWFPEENPAAAKIVEALKKKKEDKQQTAINEAAEEILQIEEKVKALVEQKVASIRRHRTVINTLKQELEEINVAHEYAKKSLNYIPLCLATNIIPMPSLNEIGKNPIFHIPEEFKNNNENVSVEKTKTKPKK